jgi:hypothetical protein
VISFIAKTTKIIALRNHNITRMTFIYIVLICLYCLALMYY